MRVDRIKLIAEMARRDLKVNELAKLAGVSRMVRDDLLALLGDLQSLYMEDETAEGEGAR